MAGGNRETTLSLSLAGGGELKLLRVDAHEALSEPFRFLLDIVAEEEFDILPNIGEPVSVQVELEGEFVRHLHGIVIAGEFIEELDGNGFAYRLLAAPASHFHTQGSDYRIFQDKTVRDIVRTVLGDCNIEYEFPAKGERKLKYCVQYGESDFAFVCRLMEEHGLYYYYYHTDSAHVMVVCDDPGQHLELDQPDIIYNPMSSSVGVRDSQASAITGAGVFFGQWNERVTSGAENKVAMRDYDFIQPDKARNAETKDQPAHTDDTIEVYQWPGRFYDDAEGGELTEVVLESRRAQRLTYTAACFYPGFIPGFNFNLKKHTIERYNAKYLVTRCHTSLANEQFRSGPGGGQTRVEISAIPAKVKFRAPMTTPRPFARGPETAVVTGPAAEEIYVDEYGRIKVQFHWDREGQLDDKSSCWVRVSQTGGLGNIVIPRVGHEVIVDFVNGNPDRPIVVGRVFNKSHMPVYKLPAEKTKTLWRTKTYKEDTGHSWPGAQDLDTKMPGANEIRMDDATDKQEFFIHAEKDMKTRIRNDESHKVGKDVEVWVGVNRTEEVGKNEKITIGADRTEEVKGEEKVTVHKDRTVTIKSNDKLDVTQKITVKSGTEIEVTANTKITFKCGASEIEMSPSGIKMKSVTIEITGQATAKMSAALTNVEAQGILTAKGGLVLIN